MEEDDARSIQLVSYDSQEKIYTFNKELLLQAIEENDVQDLPVAVISIAGLFRRGKSFLLNFFIRYLSAENRKKWIGNYNEPLQGFKWRGGVNRHTEGIHMWSKIFKLPASDEKEVAVILMDTQGTFDGKSSNKAGTTIFALSALLSSVQIYNLSRHIDEDDLNNLEWFVEYAKFVQGETELKPFQSLVFLLRDWENDEEYAHGEKGGMEYLHMKLKTTSDQDSGLSSVRNNIRSAFDKLSCFLLPHPGKAVTRKSFDGNLKDIDKEFMEQINKFVPSIFCRNSLTIKTNYGSTVKCSEFVELFSTYLKHYNSDELPSEMSKTEAAAEVYYMPMLQRCLDSYRKSMSTILDIDDDLIEGYTSNVFADKHKESVEMATKHFVEAKQFNKVFAKKFSEKLHRRLEASFESYEEKVRVKYNQAAEKYYDALVDKCLDEYNNRMIDVFCTGRICMENCTVEGFAQIHETNKTLAAERFEEAKRFSEFNGKQYSEKIARKIEASFCSFEQRRKMVFETAVEAYYKEAMDMCLKEYNTEMLKVLNENEDGIKKETFAETHEIKSDLIINKFNETKQYSEHLSIKYCELLQEGIKDSFTRNEANRSLIYNQSALKHFNPLVEKCIDEYNTGMLNVLDGSENSIESVAVDGFAQMHQRSKNAALAMFSNLKAFEGDIATQEYERLLNGIENTFSKYEQRRKNVFETAVKSFYKEFVEECMEEYNSSMIKVLDGSEPHIKQKAFAKIHEKNIGIAIDKYNQVNRYNETIFQEYCEIMKKRIETSFSSYEERRSREYRIPGTSIRILTISNVENQKYEFNTTGFQRIIEENGVQDLPVVVISVAGAFRKGKSFLLNFFLRYLDAENRNSWLETVNVPLQGFEWKGGVDRHTEGIHMWSEIFKLPMPDGKEVAVILIDTQGTFDGNSSNKAGTTIFALSSLFSSNQIYNLSQQIDEDDLQNLEYFLAHTNIVRNEQEKLQSLMFLLRDWENDNEFNYGSEGGNTYMAKKLESTHGDSKSTKVRENIQSVYDEISCFLMPPPGKAVQTSEHFSGKINQIDEEFLEHINFFVRSFFGEQLVVKRNFDGSSLSCEDFVGLCANYVQKYNEYEIQQKSEADQRKAEMGMEAVYIKTKANCLIKYKSEMNGVLKESKTRIKDFETKHQSIKQKQIDSIENLCSQDFQQMHYNYTSELEREIEEEFTSLEKKNDAKWCTIL